MPRIGIAGAALWAALALSAFSTPVSAQSYLSGLPESELPAGASEAEELPPTVTEGEYRPLQALFDQVALGNGHLVYEELKARFGDEMIRAALMGWTDLQELHRTYSIHLLRAGEGFAPAAEQERAARAFSRFYPDDENFPAAFFYLNQALYRQEKPLEESFFFDREALASLPAWMQSRYLRMQAWNQERSGNLAAAAEYLLAEKESADTLGLTRQGEVEELLERLDSPVPLLDLLEAHPEVAWLTEREPFLIARTLFNNGQLGEALLQLGRIRSRGLEYGAEDVKFVNDLKSEINARVMVRPDRIGVLLPLGSSSTLLRSLAVETLEGLRMAVQFPGVKGPAVSPLSRLLAQDIPVGMNIGNRSGSDALPAFELVIEDTANSPRRAAELVESLARDEQVIAIIGPIARAESAAAAEKAEVLGVPLISLSLSLEIPPQARFVFRHSKDQEGEVRDLVRYAVDYLQARRFAILHPNTRYGRTMMEMFWREVERHGGRVVAVADFDPSVRVTRLSRKRVGFKEIFERFTGMDRHLSEEERELLEAVGDSGPDPIVDFDALFIPVGPNGIQDLQLIAPYPVTVDAENVQLLGSRFWNASDVLVAGDGKLEGAVFVDAFDLTSANPKVAAFHNRHRTFFGHMAQYRPPTYYTGLGYDTAKLLMTLLQRRENRTRSELRNALVNMAPLFGVTGWSYFQQNGEAVKESMFFRIQGREILRVVP